HLSQGRLDEAVAQAGLDLDAWIDPQGLVDVLTGVYRTEGFLKATVAVAPPRMDGTTGVLPVAIDEGPQALIGEVRMVGVSDRWLEVVRSAMGIEAETPYSSSVATTARQRVLREYRLRGFNAVDVRLATEIPEDGQGLLLTVTVQEGPQQVLKDVYTTGATRTRAGVVDRALRLRVGEPVNLDDWAEARRRLYDTNVFRTVDVQAVPLGDVVDGVQPVRAFVTVEEYPRLRLRYGFELNRERIDEGEDGRLDSSPGVIADLRNANLFGRAIAGGITGRFERDYQNGSLFLSNGSFFGLPVRSSAYVYTTRDGERADGNLLFVETNRGLSLEQRWRRRGLELTYGYRYEWKRVYDPDPTEESNVVDELVRRGRLNSAVFLDRRDNPLDSTTGTFSSFSWERTVSTPDFAPVGGQLIVDRYVRLLAQQQVFVRVGPVVLASRAILGDLLNVDHGRVGSSELFFAGGGTTVRGYAESALGPRTYSVSSEGSLIEVPAGGEQLAVLNQEARFPIYRWLGGVGFLDAGNVFPDAVGFQWSDLKIGYGAGLRVNSPIGLLRLDFGIPGSRLTATSRRANSLSSGRWYFGFGQIF
ncbi:MAG: BamA/TamA family outer membrane protein, partial [Acidobacteriota bacterium]|nr:BamA/TamA family outer membrane protein [Acidobacteriota bacterium]